MKIEKFEMERMQCLCERVVEFNLSESGVLPLRLSELLDGEEDVEHFLANELWYSACEGSQLFRERIAQFYTECKPENITVTNGGSEANYVTLWTLLEPGSRLAFMIPSYMQAWGLGRAYASGVDTFQLILKKEAGQYRWVLDLEGLRRAVTPQTNVIRENLHPIEEWFLKHDDIFTYVRPQAGAITYSEYKLPIKSTELIKRLRIELSVLLTPGDQFGLDKGFRIGFGYDLEKTLNGLARAETLMRTLM